MAIQPHDFIEIDYTGKLEDGTVFDTTDPAVAKTISSYNKDAEYKPMTICVGEQHVVRGLDEALINKETGKNYTIKLTPEQAFGKKDAKKIRLVPATTFYKQRIMPQPGLEVNIDGTLARILRVSGGRILVDFNHPVAGRNVTYEINIKKIITDKKDQVKSYLGLALHPELVKGVEIIDNKAKVTLAQQLPDPITAELVKKLIELTKVESVEFHSKKAEKKEQIKSAE